MEKLLSSLNSIPEYPLLCTAIRRGEAAAITGIGQINRSHFIAALHREISRPLVVLCQDDMAAKRSLYENGTPTTVESHGSLVGKYSHPAYGFFEIAPNEEGKLVFHYGIVTGEIRVEPSGVLSAYNGWLDGLTPVGVELYPEPNGDLRVNHPDNYGLILTFVKEK